MVQLRINQTGIYLEDSLAALRPADMNKQVVCIVLSLVGEKKRLLDWLTCHHDLKSLINHSYIGYNLSSCAAKTSMD